MIPFEDAQRRDITVKGLILTTALIYDEGHECDEHEARTLNQTRCENLRNNFASEIQKAIDEAKVTSASELSAEVKAQLQRDFDMYAKGYTFEGRGAIVDPVRTQAIQLAMGKIKETLKKKGHRLSDIGADKIKEMAEQAVDSKPVFMERAAKIIEMKRAAAEELSIDL